METQDYLKIIYALTDSLYSAAFATSNEELFDLMKEPEEGDYVLEKTTGHSDKHFSYRFGKLKKKCREPFQLSDESKKEYEETGEKIPEETVYYIELPNGKLFRWHNASFVKVPHKAWCRWKL